MKNSSNWFSIPANDFERSKKFYETLYGENLETMDDEVNNEKMFMLPCDMKGGGACGAVTYGKSRTPSKYGTLVYLNFSGNLQEVLNEIKPAGGKVIIPKSPMGKEGEYGEYAVMEDSEGNNVGLFSPKL